MSQSRSPLARLLARIHRDERGAVSIETVLIVAAIALPILIYVIKVGWPKLKTFFNKGLNDLESGSSDALK
jgi:Flp pilus assembly pilin Flp